MGERLALAARAVVPWWLVVCAALLSLALGSLLAWGLAGDRSSPAAPGSRSPAVARDLLSGLPLSAQGTVSSTLGAADARYRVSSTHGVLQALNPAQRLRLRFERSGVLLSSGATRLGLSLRAVGYGRALGAVGAATPTPHGSRVLYARPALGESYANGPLGLEQGFTLARAPAGSASGPLTLALAVSGDVHAALAPGGRSVLFTSPGGPSLRYGELAASDARGRALRSWLVVQGRRILLRVDARGARYPLRIDPLAQQGAPLSGSGEEAGEEGERKFGYSVALSEDGGTALVGGPKTDDTAGGVWVFVRSGATWTLQQKLVGNESPAGESTEQCGEGAEEINGCGFGRSVALSANGDTALIGAPRADEAFGVARVFMREGASWTETATLERPAGEAAGRFGKSVALSADGATAVVGAPAARGNAGAAWVFTRAGEGSGWSRGEELTGPESSEAHFGLSVALSGDGSTVLIGGPTADANVGAAWVFARAGSGAPFVQQGAILTGGGGELGEGRFGYSVALSANGDTALIGARSDDEGSGAAWVFTRSGSQQWARGPKLAIAAGGEAPRAAFGYSVALSGDGQTALIGGPALAPEASGAAWVFADSGSGWSQQQEIRASEEIGIAFFGASVALSADAEHALVGAPTEAGGKGEALPYAVGPEVTKVEPGEGPAGGGTTVTVTGSGFQEDGSDVVERVAFGYKGPDAEPNLATNVTVDSPTSLTAVSPKGAAGKTVNVLVSANGEESAESEDDRFTYHSTPKSSSPGGGSGKGKEETPAGGASGNGASGNGSGGSAGTGGGAGASGGVLAFGPTPSASCSVSLHSRAVAVRAPNRASVKLLSSGVAFSGECAGKLTLVVKVRVKSKKAHEARFAHRTIGTASFAIDAGRSATVTLRLDAAGRRLLASHHGRMSAKLVILDAVPAPASTHSAIVRLSLQKTHAAKRRKQGKS